MLHCQLRRVPLGLPSCVFRKVSLASFSSSKSNDAGSPPVQASVEEFDQLMAASPQKLRSLMQEPFPKLQHSETVVYQGDMKKLFQFTGYGSIVNLFFCTFLTWNSLSMAYMIGEAQRTKLNTDLASKTVLSSVLTPEVAGGVVAIFSVVMILGVRYWSSLHVGTLVINKSDGPGKIRYSSYDMFGNRTPEQVINISDISIEKSSIDRMRRTLEGGLRLRSIRIRIRGRKNDAILTEPHGTFGRSDVVLRVFKYPLDKVLRWDGSVKPI
eukprot:TRINITY_DN12094_c0_g1_i1.p2 TRINITY_DN12094_c0_g1~~TRINITY_DN12094_c0_g1_i1.p2  ORF type:complete len:269 (+),score=54.95 TRINITY_DN12094_c0_g1_i1:218-1024(+)